MADRQTLLTWAATARYVAENAGIILDGVEIPTDDQTRAVLTAAYIRAVQDETFSIPNWKVSAGVYVTLDRDKIIAIGNAVTAHIQACFDKNKDVDLAIEGGEITTHEQIKDAFEELN